jgi:hypothetical protein
MAFICESHSVEEGTFWADSLKSSISWLMYWSICLKVMVLIQIYGIIEMLHFVLEQLCFPVLKLVIEFEQSLISQ